MLPRQILYEYNKINRGLVFEMTESIWDNKLTEEEEQEHRDRLIYLKNLWESNAARYCKRRAEFYSKDLKTYRDSIRAQKRWGEKQAADRAEQVAKDVEQLQENAEQVVIQTPQAAMDAEKGAEDGDWVVVDDAEDDFIMALDQTNPPEPVMSGGEVGDGK